MAYSNGWNQTEPNRTERGQSHAPYMMQYQRDYLLTFLHSSLIFRWLIWAGKNTNSLDGYFESHGGRKISAAAVVVVVVVFAGHFLFCTYLFFILFITHAFAHALVCLTWCKPFYTFKQIKCGQNSFIWPNHLGNTRAFFFTYFSFSFLSVIFSFRSYISLCVCPHRMNVGLQVFLYNVSWSKNLLFSLFLDAVVRRTQVHQLNMPLR